MLKYLFSSKKREELHAAEELLQRGDLEGAVKGFRQLGHTPGLIAAGESCLAKKNHRQALQLFQEANHRAGLKQVADMLMERGSFADLEKILKLIHGQVPAAEYERLGRLFLQRGDLQTAEKAFLASGVHAGLTELAEHFIARKDLGNAARIFRKISSSDGLRRLADQYLEADDLDRAAKLFEEIQDAPGLQAVARKRAALAGQSRPEHAAGSPDSAPDPDDPNFQA